MTASVNVNIVDDNIVDDNIVFAICDLVVVAIRRGEEGDSGRVRVRAEHGRQRGHGGGKATSIDADGGDRRQ